MFLGGSNSSDILSVASVPSFVVTVNTSDGSDIFPVSSTATITISYVVLGNKSVSTYLVFSISCANISYS